MWGWGCTKSFEPGLNASTRLRGSDAVGWIGWVLALGFMVGPGFGLFDNLW